MTTTTLPVERRSLPRRNLVLAAIAAATATAAITAGVLVAQSDGDDAPPAAVSASPRASSSLPGSADAAERWTTGNAAALPSSADAAERWATGDAGSQDASRYGSADAAERSAG